MDRSDPNQRGNDQIRASPETTGVGTPKLTARSSMCTTNSIIRVTNHWSSRNTRRVANTNRSGANVGNTSANRATVASTRETRSAGSEPAASSLNSLIR